MHPFSILNAIAIGLMVNPLLKITIAGTVAALVAGLSGLPQATARSILLTTLIVALGGSTVFHILMLFPGGIVGVLIGILAFWYVTTFAIDVCLNAGYDESHALTGRIVAPTVLIWLIIGLILHTLSAV